MGAIYIVVKARFFMRNMWMRHKHAVSRDAFTTLVGTRMANLFLFNFGHMWRILFFNGFGCWHFHCEKKQVFNLWPVISFKHQDCCLLG